MTKKFWLAALASTLICFAQGPRPDHGKRGGAGQFEALKNYLGLTDTQLASLRQARTDAFAQAKPEMKANSEKARELRAEMSKANPDPNTVGRLMTEMKQSRAQRESNQGQLREKSLAVLSEAQKAKLKALEDAASLQDAVREARMSGLLTAPAGGDSPMRGPRGFHAH
ncbi:MAG: periplasmic heavy metal sensor [Bryobacteraceae bacterium]|nr:periplasmic heavy metal sensor [Bryobacteraceae bacterium]